MKKQDMSRREVISFLGIKVPIVLLGVQLLPGAARGEEPYIQISYRMSAAKLDRFMGDWSNRSVVCAEYRDGKGDAVGTIIRELDEVTAESDIIQKGDIIYKFNDKPLIIESQEDHEEWSKFVKEAFRNKKRVTIDLDRDDESLLIVIEFD